DCIFIRKRFCSLRFGLFFSPFLICNFLLTFSLSNTLFFFLILFFLSLLFFFSVEILQGILNAYVPIFKKWQMICCQPFNSFHSIVFSVKMFCQSQITTSF